MKKILLLTLLSFCPLFSFDSDIRSAIAIGIFHENGRGENIQHKKITDDDYNGTCFSKIVIFGNYSNNSKIEVTIGNSIGYYEGKIPIFNDFKIKIGDELTFKHYDVSSGYFQVKINNKLYDTKVFVK